jgi:diguanylate cyclase (GGDEF)-like protein
MTLDLTMNKLKTFPILLVEDNPGDARLVREMLGDVASTEFDVHHVERLAQARERLMHNGTGCVLLDLSLPDANRLEALMQLRAAAPDVPIVILSGLQDELLAVKAVQEGAQDYLIKGRVDGESLGRSINYAIERKQSELELARRAMHDPLTGLANRALFLDRLIHAVSWSRRHRSTFSIMFIDIDRFKLINDSLGNETGDQVLVEVARRLGAALRGSDTAARFGGDEFIVLCEEISDEQQAVRVAERIMKGLEKPLELESDTMFVTASMGIVVASGVDVEDAEALIREADEAMFRAKKRGVRCELFDTELRTRVVERQEMERKLREAVEKQEFRVLYQPQIDLRTGEILGVEALVRWDHPERGLLAPADFIWLAEETGLIVPIGSWVLKEALGQAQKWRAARPDKPLRLCVNLSARQHSDPNLIDLVRESLEETGTDPSTLCLEITETVMMQDVETSFQTLRALRELGVGLSVDDFGTGYSSLGSLKRFPVDSLKVDRSFVAGLGNGRGSEDAAIVTAVISLAHTLGLTAVAEGIESADQLEQLRALDCDIAQGFYFARPRPATVITELLGAE